MKRQDSESYVDNKRQDSEFEKRGKVLLKVSLSKEIMRFGKKGS